MKKYLLPTAALMLALTACEDVPAPYEIHAGSSDDAGQTAAKALPYSESFATSLGGFANVLLTGGGAWTINYSTATATGYDNSTKVTTVGSYMLVSPQVVLTSAQAHVTYSYILRYDKGSDNQQVLITNHYTGSPSTTEWTVLKKDHTEGSDWSTFADADVSVPASMLGDTVRVAFYYNTPSSGSTWEVKNFAIAEGSGAAPDGSTFQPAGSGSAGGSEVMAEPAGDGTEASPYNVARALTLIREGKYTSAQVYVKGTVTKIDDIDTGQYGNATYYLSDGGETTAELEVYRGYGLGGAKFTSADAFAVGDVLVIKGELTMFRETTPEVTQGSSIISINGVGGGSTSPEVKPSTASAPEVTVAEFLTLRDEQTVYQLRGVVRNVKNTNYGNFDLEQDGAVIYVYGLVDADGKNCYTPLGLAEGDSIVVQGAFTLYNETPEVKNAVYVSMTKGTDAGSGTGTDPGTDPPAEDFTLVNGDFETWLDDSTPDHWKTASSAGNATLSRSTDAHGGSYSVRLASNAANRRLGYVESTLPAGTYTVRFYAKSGGECTNTNGRQCRPGYTPVDGTTVGTYVYGDYQTITTDGWTEVTYQFTLDATTRLSLVVMNPKNSGELYIDDYTVTRQ